MAALGAVVSTRRRKRAETTFEWHLARSVSAQTACLTRRLPISSTNQCWPDDREPPSLAPGLPILLDFWTPTRPSTTDQAGVLSLPAPGRDRGVCDDPE